MTDDLVDCLIKKHEGLRLKPYKDTTGNITIGYGCNLSKGISKEIANILYYYDKEIATSDAIDIFENFELLNEVRRAVLIDMAYNLGKTRLSTFKKMIAAVYNFDFEVAAMEMLDSKWADQVGQRAISLSVMMSSGEL